MFVGITSYKMNDKLLNITKDCINSLLNQTIQCDIYLIDCGTDFTSDWINWLIENNIKLIKQEVNCLYKMWNSLCDLAFNDGEYDYALITNNDVIFESDAVSRSIIFDAGFTIPRLKDTNTSTAPFSCFVISKDTFKKVGRFNERYTYVYGDIDYKIRMNEQQIPYTPNPNFVIQTIGQASYRANPRGIYLTIDKDRNTFFRQYKKDSMKLLKQEGLIIKKIDEL